MTPVTPNHELDRQGCADNHSVAEELKRESDRLLQLADELQAREAAQTEMQANYPHFKRFVYAAMREHFERVLPPLPDKDLETVAREEGALPLEEFIGELERRES